MERLRHMTASDDPRVAFAARLLNETSPHRASPHARARVRAEVLRRGRRRKRVALRSTVLLTLLLIGILGTASAKWGRPLATRLVEWVRQGGQARLVPSAAPAPDRTQPLLAPAAPAAAAVPPPVEKAAKRAAARSSLDRKSVARPKRVVAPPPSEADEPQRVSAAFVLLRRDHNPRAASVLLDAYFREHPTGKLTEEALALRIEAARALGADAERFAHLYLAQFPSGRFRELAQRILSHH